MSRHNGEIYDVVIIGAGISGLVCGCYLAKAGMKVLLVEQHDKPGGYFTSFKRKGFLFDAAAHSFGNYRDGGHVRKIFTELGVENHVKIIRSNPSDIVISPDFTLTFWNDARDTLHDMERVFPDEKENLRRFFRFLTTPDHLAFVKLRDKSFDFLLRSFFTNERLMAALSLPVFGNGGLPPTLMHAFSGSKILSEFILDGGYYPDGGIQALPDALVRIIRQNNGVIHLRTSVRKILTHDASVSGVLLDSETTVSSRYVVAACDMVETFFRLLDMQEKNPELASSVKSLTPSISTFILYLGLDSTFDGLPERGSNIWYLPHYDLKDMYDRIERCELTQRVDAFMLRVSPDGRTVLAFKGAPFRDSAFWRQNKRAVTDDFVKRIDALIPALGEHLACTESATPSTLYRYTLNHSGAAFGWAKTPAQTYDPVFSKRTAVHGLYLTGHWTSIAFGMPGACYTGHDTAMRLIRRERTGLKSG